MNNELGYSVFRFVLPFYCQSDKGSVKEPFCLPDWKQFSINTKYLTQSVYELFDGELEAVCKCYSLNDIARPKYSVPGRYSEVTLHSDMPACKGDYHFFLTGHRIIWFESGLGFLVMDVQIPEKEISNAANISFCISNVFTNEHDSGGRTNNLVFSYNGEQSVNEFSIKNSLMKLIFGDTDGKGIELFPSSTRKRLITYHSIITEKETDDDDKLIYCLANSLHSGIKYDGNVESGNSISSFADQKWFLGPNGVATIAKYKGNDSFVTKVHKRNVDFDYFYIFILALHEREILLKDNYYAVKYRNNPKKLIAMKNQLLTVDILYSFNTISIESSYQRFYTGLVEIFNLENFRSDIRNVVENVESHVNDKKDRKVNAVLTAISILAIFSVLMDGIGFADRIESGDPFGILQWLVVVLVALFFAVAIFVLKKK